MVDVVRNAAVVITGLRDIDWGAALCRGVSSPNDSLYEANPLSSRVPTTLAMQLVFSIAERITICPNCSGKLRGIAALNTESR